MASVGSPAPRLPEPPAEYNQQYMADVLRAVQFFMEQERNPGELRGTKITLTELPTSASGLETGALYNDSGTVKVVT
jgi:hypothetical protein